MGDVEGAAADMDSQQTAVGLPVHLARNEVSLALAEGNSFPRPRLFWFPLIYARLLARIYAAVREPAGRFNPAIIVAIQLVR
eukprot:COSAG01_NODE_273_length_19739_cov_90.981925_14_plen_82_part_00